MILQNPTVFPLLPDVIATPPPGFKPTWKRTDFNPYRFSRVDPKLKSWVTVLEANDVTAHVVIDAMAEPTAPEFWAMLETTIFMRDNPERLWVTKDFDPVTARSVVVRHARLAVLLVPPKVIKHDPNPVIGRGIARKLCGYYDDTPNHAMAGEPCQLGVQQARAKDEWSDL